MQADPEPTGEVHEDIDNEDKSEPPHHNYNTKRLMLTNSFLQIIKKLSNYNQLCAPFIYIIGYT